MTTTRPTPVPAHTAALYLPAPLPRDARIALWSPEGPPPSGAEDTVTVVRRQGAVVRARTAPARILPLAEALPLLVAARHAPTAHPATRCWGAAALHALHLVSRGLLLPGLTRADDDAWRAGPPDAADVAQLRAIAAALPPEGYAVPLSDRTPLQVPDPAHLVRSFVDAVADVLPRTPAAALAFGDPFASHEAQNLPRLREWAAEVAAGADAGVRVSLRLDLPADGLFDSREEDDRSREEDGGDPPEGRSARNRTEGPRRAGAAVVQVHSLADPTHLVDAVDLWAGDGGDSFGPRARVDTVLALRRAGRVWPPLARLLEQPVPDVLPLSDEELYDLLGAAAHRLEAAGVTVHWPRELARTLTATAVVRPAPGSATDGTAFFDAEHLFAFSWQLALGGEDLTEAEMDALVEEHRPVVRLRDQWVVVDPELVRKARKRQLGLLDPADALEVALTGTAEVDGERVDAVPVGALATLRDRLARGGADTLPQPPALKATLRDYQLRGLAWLDLMTSLGLGGCLADDMGLGKTITVIALHLHRVDAARAAATPGAPAAPGPRTAPTLVVCPASLLGNWQREIERFAPGVPVRRFHGAARTLDDLATADGLFDADAARGTAPDAPPPSRSYDGGFVLTTYGTMRTSAAQLATHTWNMIVADEAQHLKNARSSTAKALRTIPTPARIALTGTPVENNLSELWALLDWTTPGLLGPLTSFRARHARAVEGGEDPEAVERLARLVRPFLLRRKKSDPGIAPELPPKTETDHPVSLSREQVALYQAAVHETMAAIETSEGIARRGLIMKLLTSLKQICNHPAQYLKEGGSKDDPPRLATTRSGKLALLDELLDTILAEEDSVLIFTQYVSMARLLSRHLAARAIPAQLLHGGTPVAQREEMVDRFQSGEVPVFLLSLKAAGTGLNLTRAAHVVHFDRWWNPAVEEQATDRAYRIGQTQPVQVHRLIAEGTVEDRIAELLASKRSLADAILGSGEAALTELTDRELADLVSLRRPS
ncbi:DEAD/DEAH box helicase [Streptomyces sp. NBC_00237]|uniref:DEAD/DEAH box helicase n=1 Tax=Streptomyces sp. NBC_00237 TaxID=2975687 RepID=UPI002253D9A8|nr:DEAD/DEAH box helicase [Streptomyces sp. NBC_00237]MCX5201921.1 DEAD/DEAH box helicase [Streptomyces sp. NBC_00237]